MQLNVISDLNEFESLADEWNNLLTCCSASHVPFLRHEYLDTWWKTLGGGEWEHGELYIVTGRNGKGELIGIAPLFFTNNLENRPALMLMGSIEISDYLDVLVGTEDAAQFMGALFELLSADQAAGWEILDLYNIIEDSPTLPALKAAAEGRGWSYEQKNIQHCPYIPLPGDWDAYLAGIRKKQRHEIRRKMRRAQEFAVPVNWYIVEDESKLDGEIDDFLDLMAQDPEKDKFLSDAMRSQFRAAAQVAFRAGWLQLAFLNVGNQKAAGYMNFDYDGHIWVYNSGINFDFREYSPGWVLLGHLLKWANDNERKIFDFLRGDESYKYRFGAVDRFVVRATVSRN